MPRRPNPQQLHGKKTALLERAIMGRTEASSSHLSSSFGLSIVDVRRILKTKGIHDNG